MLGLIKEVIKNTADEMKRTITTDVSRVVAESFEASITRELQAMSLECENRTQKMGEAAVEGLKKEKKVRSQGIANAVTTMNINQIRHHQESENLKHTVFVYGAKDAQEIQRVVMTTANATLEELGGYSSTQIQMIKKGIPRKPKGSTQAKTMMNRQCNKMKQINNRYKYKYMHQKVIREPMIQTGLQKILEMPMQHLLEDN